MGALSDLAAMGAAPLGALVALCVPGGSGEGDLALGVMAGVAQASEASGCPVVGRRPLGGGPGWSWRSPCSGRWAGGRAAGLTDRGAAG